jgi:hypothetical protein
MSFLLSLLLLLAPPVKVEHGRFNIIKDGKSIGTDEFTVSRHDTNYVLEGKTTIGDLTMTSRIEVTDKLVPVSYEVTTAGGTTRVNIASPVSELQTVVNGETESAKFRFPEGGVILDNNLFDHYLILMYRAQAGQNSFAVFVPQDRSIGNATVRSTGPRTYDLEVGDVKMQATVDADGALTKLSVPAANVVVER